MVVVPEAVPVMVLPGWVLAPFTSVVDWAGRVMPVACCPAAPVLVVPLPCTLPLVLVGVLWAKALPLRPRLSAAARKSLLDVVARF